MVSRAIKAATLTMGDMAERLGLSYDAVRSWSIGRTTPNKENRETLATFLDERADRLRGLAQDLREGRAG
jgi:transcriptional regulator with XRE-family HTH domain